jgi:hypothetical protein
VAERIDNRLLFQILKGLQTRVTMLEAMLGDIRDGFASIRAQRSVRGEAGVLERRVDELERSLEPLIERRMQNAGQGDRL